MTPTQYRRHREQLRLTQAELAAKLGVSRETINRRESGKKAITGEAEMAIRSLEKYNGADVALFPPK